MKVSRGADALLDQLLECGVDALFTLPGIQIMSVFDAMWLRRDSFRIVHTRHEQSATYMAYGYAQACGRPAAVVVVPGPGLLNGLSGMASAYGANVPMLVISGQIPRDAVGRRQGHLHEIVDQLDAVRPVTKWRQRVAHGRGIPGAIREAYQQAVGGRPGPVEVEFPPEALSEAVDSPVEALGPPQAKKPRAEDVLPAIEMLANADRPAIVAGGGTLRAGCAQELRAVAELLGAPVLTTQNAKGILPEDDDAAVGVTYFQGLGPAYQVLPKADVILCVGTRLFIRGFSFSESQKVINVNIDPDELSRNHEVTLGIESDAAAFLGELAEGLTRRTLPRTGSLSPAAHKRAFRKQVEELAPLAVETIKTLRSQLARDAIVVSGMNSIGYWSHVAFDVYEPRTYITPGFMGALGFAYPTALGAKVAAPERQVVALCGDGGFLFCEHELATAVQQNLEVIAIVFNNGGYGASEWDQDILYEGRRIGTSLVNPDFVKLADAFGAVGLRCDISGFSTGLERALQVRGQPVLLEVTLPNMRPPFRWST